MQSSCQQAQDTTRQASEGTAPRARAIKNAQRSLGRSRKRREKVKVKVKASVRTCHSCATGGLAGEERRKKNEEYSSKNKDEKLRTRSITLTGLTAWGRSHGLEGPSRERREYSNLNLNVNLNEVRYGRGLGTDDMRGHSSNVHRTSERSFNPTCRDHHCPPPHHVQAQHRSNGEERPRRQVNYAARHWQEAAGASRTH